jgi:hypothetical protein
MEEVEDDGKADIAIVNGAGKCATIPSSSKGRGVSGFTKGRVGVHSNCVSADVDPFLTGGAVSETACLSCVSTMNDLAGDSHDCDPFASPMPTDGGEW